ncbi:MAG: hypothetical protein V4616_09970 [Bacteroidota bacterium]
MRRIEIKEKNQQSWRKVILIGFAVYSGGVLINVYLFGNSWGKGMVSAIGVMVFGLAMGWMNIRRAARLKHYFVEWDEQTLKYNCGKGERIIPLESVKGLSIHLDDIVLNTTSGKEKLEIGEFTEYEDRLAIKKFLQQLPQLQ